MTIPYPDYLFERIFSRALAKRTVSFVGVCGNAVDAQRRIPIRLRLSEADFDSHADSTLLDRHTIGQPVCMVNGKASKNLTENGLPTLPPPSSPQTCPFAAEGPCHPCNYLNVTLGNEELGSFAFHSLDFNSLQTLASKLRSFQVISGKRLACLKMELRLRAKPTRQNLGRPIYYVDITIRSGTALEKTLANARGTASRWFRSDHPEQSRLARHRPRRFRSPPS
ncbi:MAG: hypothetical protein ACR65R_11750 [Methylomicrobium sp.]